MSTITARIDEIEKEMARTQKNKATEKHLGGLKAKLAQLRRLLVTPSSSGGPGAGFDVQRTGIASIGLVGFPSVGKSTLMSDLTGVESRVAAFEFTTLTCIPGTMTLHGTQLQILDLPGIIEGASDNKGRGRAVIAVARNCSLIYMCLDVTKPLVHKKLIEKELYDVGIRLNQVAPLVNIKKKEKGGVMISHSVALTKISQDEIKAVCAAYKLNSADIHIKEDIDVDQFVDVLEGNRSYVPCVYILNKIDGISIQELDLLYKIPHSVPISSRHGWNIDELKEATWGALDLVRVYTRPKGREPDYSAPVILKRRKCTVEDFCNAIHKEIAKQMKAAIVWGASVRHQRGQRCGLEHVLEDEDVICIVKR